MINNFTDFFGSKSTKYDSDFCTVSVVNYINTVSEEWHCHENFHLSGIIKGGNQESRKKTDIQVLPGKTLIYHPGEIHRNRFTEFPSKNLNLEIKDSFFKNNHLSPFAINSSHSGNIDHYFYLIKIYYELAINDYYTYDIIDHSLQTIFSKEEKLYTKPLWLNKLHNILADRWDSFIPLEDLALELQVHPVTISKYFKKHYQCTLADYMRKVKVEKAIHLIFNTQSSLANIAYTCGFSDQSHMTRLFKFYLGVKPKALSYVI